MISILRRGALAALAAVSLAGAAQAQSADPNRLFSDSRIVVRDRFSDETVGKGKDVVFIPGLASSRATWKATAERLRGKYRLHLIQIAGFSGEPARANATGDVLVPTAEAIDAYLVSEKLTPAVVVGHSMGGTMVLYLAEHHPDHLKKAMVVDALPFYGALMGGPKATPATLQPMAARIRDSALAMSSDQYHAMMAPQLARMVASAENRPMVLAWTMASDRGVVGRALYDDMLLDLAPDLGAIRTPIVLLYPDDVPVGAPVGATDKMYPALYAAAKTVSLKRIDASAHFIMLDQPKAFADALDAFLATP